VLLVQGNLKLQELPGDHFVKPEECQVIIRQEHEYIHVNLSLLKDLSTSRQIGLIKHSFQHRHPLTLGKIIPLCVCAQWRIRG